MTDRDFDAWEVELHGHRVIYRTAGAGPPLVLIHGMVNSSKHWREVALRLADRHTVIAPDLIGHGDSATPRGDYSLGAHAAAIRDLLTVIGVREASFVGHSLGGGVAMQFFWQFPERVQRLVLVSSGGLGHEVGPLLRGRGATGGDGGIAGRGERSRDRRHRPRRRRLRGARLAQGRLPAGDRPGAAPARAPRRPRRLPARRCAR